MSLISRTDLSAVQNSLFQAIWDWLPGHSDLDIDQNQSELAPISHAGDPDVVFTCGLPTGQAVDHLQPLVAPVLAADRYGGRPIYFSDLVVRAGRRGPPAPAWRIGFNQKDSFSGWIAPRWGLAALGIEVDSMTWVATGSHLKALEAVKAGTVDAAGIDSMVLDLISGETAPGAGLETIESFGPWPAPPISTSTALDPSVRARLAEALTTMHQEPSGLHLLATWGVARLAPVEAAEYGRLARFASTTATT